jgi:hypothetical protein
MEKIMFLCCLIFSSPTFTQSNAVKKRAWRVIALNGLNIRAQPGIDASIVGGIPFMEEVQLLDTILYKRDTIGQHVHYDNKGQAYTYYHVGNWVRIRYAATEGYVFNAYLANLRAERWLPHKGFDHAFALNFETFQCFDNIHRNGHLKWKGAYQTEDGIEIKPVEIEYINDADPENFAPLKVFTKNNRNLLFLIGDENDVIKEGKVKGAARHIYDGSSELYIQSTGHSLLAKDKKIEVIFDDTAYPALYLKERGKRQLLNPKSLHYSYPVQILWQGDMDGDNREDFIIHYGSKVGQTVLYLSSQAKEDELVRPVAIYLSGYCC